MTTREVVLDGGSPWGFRMHGGVDVQQPLRISRVNPGSKAAIKGIREGDIITSINNQPTRDITNADAHLLLKKSGETLKLGLNEDCRGSSPKRRQYNKTIQQESHSESIERSTTSKTSFSSSTSVTINRSQSDSNDKENLPSTNTNGQAAKSDGPENGLISQRSTLSSSCSSGPSGADTRGIGIEILHQGARDTAVRNNESSSVAEVIVTKPVSADNEKDVIADIGMGGNSRSHKRRSRASRKKTKNSNVVSTDAPTCEAMVEVPTPLNSDVTERGNDVENSCEGSVTNSDNATENAEIQSIAENKVFERIQTNYRVESPETVSKKSNTNKKQNGGTVVKSKSLDDDDLVKITELSEASEGEDKSLAECNAVVSEADSDVDWETTEEFKSEKRSEERGECLSTLTLPLEELETVQVTLISPEDERNLRTFLHGLKLVTSPEEAVKQTQKKESYKERKARKRAAIAEHFMPVLQFPRFLDAIREENNDGNADKDKEQIASTSSNLEPFIKSQEFVRSKNESIQKRMETHFPKTESEKVVVVEGKLIETANVQGTCSTSVAETSSSAAEIVYLEDSSSSKTPSDSSDIDENIDADGDDEESKSEDISHYSSLQELNATTQNNVQTSSTSEVNTDPSADIKILPPPSQLTPPPTPDLATPKNETVCERQQCDDEMDDYTKNVMLCLSNKNYASLRAATKNARFKDLSEEIKSKVNEVLPEMNNVSLEQEDTFNKEFKGFCDELNLQNPCKYVNAVSPPAPSRSPSVSSEGSSKTNSQCTARYNPMCSSIGDVADLLRDEENAKETLKWFQPETLRELCLKELISLPFGADVLEELAEVSQSIQDLTGTWQTKMSPSLQRLRKHLPTPSVPAFMLKNPVVDGTNESFKLPVTKEEMPFITSTKWVGMPTQQDPNVLVCLSPTQKSYLETTKKVPDEAGKLLELHEKFMNRRGYHEEIHDMPVEITGLSKKDKNASSSRLLAILQETKDTQPDLRLNINDDTQHFRKDYDSYFSRVDNTQTLPRECKMHFKETTFTASKSPVQDLNDWLKLAREKSTSAPHLEEAHEFSDTIGAVTTGTYQSKAVNEGTRVQSSGGNTSRSTNIPNRRFSLPQELHQRQIQYIREKEKELQEEIEKLEKEKRKVIFEMATEVPVVRQFEAGEYHISKKGDIAIHNDEEKFQKTDTDKQKVTVMAPTEFFRQKMYDEYMKKVAAREDRKMHKVIKITSSKTSQVEESTESSKCEITHVGGIEDEFMDKVKERMRKYGLKRDDSEENRVIDSSTKTEDSQEPVLVMDGDLLKDAKELPKHLQEFVDMTRQAADSSEDDTTEGVWSPGQKSSEDRPRDNIHESQEHKKDEPIPPVWTPRSAGSSPTVERKEFRPVNFESPVLGRKNKPKAEELGTPDSPSVQPPWQVPESSSEVGVALASSLERRLPTSHSAPASGFSEFSTPRLPRAQNPTITLLQKAREGQLPRGASYIQAEPNYSYRNQDDRPPLLGPGDVLYQIKNEYTSESDSERPRKMADLGPRKYEIGIGPTTKDGMPLVLRSEVKDGNQSRWYKRMYDTIHKQKPDPRYPYMSGYFSEPEHNAFAADYYDSDGTLSDSKYATLDRRRLQPSVRDKENEYMSSTLPKEGGFANSDSVIKHGQDVYRNQPGRIENYVPGRSSISEKEAKEWWDEVMDIFDGHLEQQKNVPQPRGYMSQALKESGYESDSTLVFRRREDAIQQLSPSEQREAYKNIQKGGDVPLHGLRKPAPERPKEAEAPTPPPKGHHGLDFFETESPRKYVENEVTIHYKSPVRQEVKESLSEEELSRRQAEHMKKVYEEERRRKYLQVSDSMQELQDMNSRRHTDNFIPSQKSPIPLNRYDDFPTEDSPKIKPRPRSPEPRLVARALYNFVGQSSRELTFRKGDVIYVRRQVDKNWYEGEHNAMIGLFPANYVEIIPYDGIKSTPRKAYEGQARAKFNFIAQTHLELSLAKGELVVITRRVDDNWFEGRIGGRKGIFPVSYVEVLIDPGAPPPPAPLSSKPVASPAAHSMLVNGSAGGKESMGSHSYVPSIPYQQQFTSSYRAKPAQINSGQANYGSLTKSASNSKSPINEVLHIDTHSEPVPYRALYKYRPQNDDELELLEGDVVYVLEKCDDGWYVGSSQRTGAFGTFPGNYVERI